MIFDIETVSRNICRACLNKDPVIEISDEVYEKFKLCGGIDMEEINCRTLPSKICHKCFINLEISYEFRRICQQSDKKLKEMRNSLIELDKQDDILENLKVEFLVPKEEPDEILNQAYMSHNSQMGFDLGLDDTDTEQFFQSIRLEEEKKELKFNSENLNISNQIYKEKLQKKPAKIETKIKVKRKYKKEIKDKKLEKRKDSENEIIGELISPVKIEPNIKIQTKLKKEIKVEKIRKKNSIEGFHQCEFCGISYVSKFSMENHMRLHSARLRFVCEICGDSYAGKFQLEQHMCSKHTGERNFKCEYCDKAFFSKTLRNKHQKRSHSKLFKCDQCDKGFGRSDSLKKHKRVHSGEKPIVCDKCGTRFKELHHLKNHNKSMTPCIFKMSIKVKDV